MKKRWLLELIQMIILKLKKKYQFFLDLRFLCTVVIKRIKV